MTRTAHLILTAATVLTCMLAEAEELSPDCPVPGEPIQWVADYCMLQMQTDDEIAVSACIEENMRKAAANECARKQQYKRAMCDLFLADASTEATIKRCAEDPKFMGRTVRNGGVRG